MLKRGPFWLLLGSVMRAGGTLQEDGGLCFPGETRIDILRDPIQWVKRAVLDGGTAAAMRRVASRRPTYKHQGRIDFQLSKILTKALTKEQKSDLGSIQAGGLWTASTLFAAGLIDTPTCPWCGGEPEDLEHLWWHCSPFCSGARLGVVPAKRDTDKCLVDQVWDHVMSQRTRRLIREQCQELENQLPWYFDGIDLHFEDMFDKAVSRQHSVGGRTFLAVTVAPA